MIEVKYENGDIRVKVQGSKVEMAAEIAMLIKELVDHPVLHKALDASIYAAGGIEYLNKLVDNYSVWIDTCKEADDNDGRGII